MLSKLSVVWDIHFNVKKKVYHNQNIPGVKLINLIIFDLKILFNFFGKVKRIKTPAGFELMTYVPC